MNKKSFMSAFSLNNIYRIIQRTAVFVGVKVHMHTEFIQGFQKRNKSQNWNETW